MANAPINDFISACLKAPGCPFITYNHDQEISATMVVQRGSITPSNWSSIYDVTFFAGQIDVRKRGSQPIWLWIPPVKVVSITQAQIVLATLQVDNWNISNDIVNYEIYLVWILDMMIAHIPSIIWYVMPLTLPVPQFANTVRILESVRLWQCKKVQSCRLSKIIYTTLLTL